MTNQELAKVLRDIAILLEMDGIKFKPRAYENAAKSIETLPESVSEVYRKGGVKSLMQIPRIGQSIAEKIEEFIKTGEIEYYSKLKKKVPVDLDELSQVEGLGPKKIKALWQSLRVRNVESLEKAALAHRICKVQGFQEKTEQNILKGIEFAKKSKGRYILGFTLHVIENMDARLSALPAVKKVTVAGSIRRMKETIGDADFLVVSDNPRAVMEYFVSMPEVEDVLARGETKSVVRLHTGMHCDLRIVQEESFGAALQYFTGSKEHNIELRNIAIEKGMKLNEYGLFRGTRRFFGKTEEEIYRALGLCWIPPELRENRGEVEAARRKKLPELVGYSDLKGDLQVHSNWTDGSNSIIEMAQEAKRLGLEYIAITDHTKSLPMAHGLDDRGLERQGEEISQTNEKIDGIHVLRGAEVNILKDGRLDISDRVLERLDIVGVAVHSNFNLSKQEQTDRVVSAIRNPNVDILFHPTGRVLRQREAYAVDISRILEVALEENIVLELDATPERLDLMDEHVKLAIEKGCKICIDSDSHATTQLPFIRFGIAQARRGWARASDVVNTLSFETLLTCIKGH